MPKEWESRVPHFPFLFETLGLELQVNALDGICRITGFKRGGPAESSDMLLIEDEVSNIDGHKIPLGIGPASGRLKRIKENMGNAQRFVEVAVKRKTHYGRQTSHVQLYAVPQVRDDEDDWVVVESSESSSETESEEGVEAAGVEARGTRKSHPSAATGRKPRRRTARHGIRAAGSLASDRMPLNPHAILSDIAGSVIEAIDRETKP
mmetsp:Transcript_44334/g.69328  ORF Transcript_44334/g.69328 Transcript_44334/m.69328 type:complete len:207 (+) Transcript_44334:180-800(+)